MVPWRQGTTTRPTRRSSYAQEQEEHDQGHRHEGEGGSAQEGQREGQPAGRGGPGAEGQGRGDELQGEGTTMMRIEDDEKLAYSQVNVALEFLKDRGIVEVRHRRCYPGTDDPHLDALTEFYALAAEPKPS